MVEPDVVQPSETSRSAGSGPGISQASGPGADPGGLDFTLKKGLDVPIVGAPAQRIEDGPDVVACALTGEDYVGLKPKMHVAEGDRVRLGEPLFEDRRFEGVVYTAPAGGTVRAINRGARRVLQSVVIDIDERDEPVAFERCEASDIAGLEPERIRQNLLKSGLWPVLRTRPYSKVPDPQTSPAAVFVTAMDSSPLAADAAVVIGEAPDDFANGVRLVSRLSGGPTYVCSAPGAPLPEIAADGVRRATFAGPHPAGLVGTHIHFLDPVNAEKTVWHLNYQDAMAIGKLFRTGVLPTDRVVSMAGPAARRPRLLRTRLGASVASLIEGEVAGEDPRIVSGNILTGRRARGPFVYLGRFHHQIAMIEEGRKREAFGWLIPSMRKFATANVHLSSLFARGRRFALNTSLNGSPRAMVPVGLYEDVIPLDMLATQLLRALLVMDTEDAQALGCLELDEEDVALCSYVCMSKYEYGLALRANLEKIEAEG